MHTLSIRELGAALRKKEFTCVELTRHFLDRIEAHDPTINAFITPTPEIALAEAERADRRLREGDDSPLLGIPIAHKDIFCTQGVRTSCASKMLDNFIAPYDATVVERMRAAGAVMLGKTNMDEFAMGSSNQTSHYGPVSNPWDPARVPGGSSGGSAAAVAAGLCPLATGTETGGSIRQPASLCGLTGLKPTYGRVSRFGMIAFASSLDQAGLLARSAEDIAWSFASMSGHDPKDSTSASQPVEDYPAALQGGDLKGLRIGVVRDQFGADLDQRIGSRVEEAISQLEGLGAELCDITLPDCALSIPVYYVIAPAEASSNLSRFDGIRFGHRAQDPADIEDLYMRSRSEGFGAEVKRRIMIGTYVLSAGYYDAYYLKAQQLRRRIADDFARAFEKVDILAGPTSPMTAFPIGEKMDDPVAMYLCDIFTSGINLAGIPALSLPAGFVDGLPVGLHLMGNHFCEGRLLEVAHHYQRSSDWHRQTPAAFA
ncbi:MAG: Asp-tRNA(Asn)/Glu-tRNA(Gln) amidotransferase subunit GatA [Ectothiorhodospiraceae bacterium AqS1]|nr:Asp-tRNA(Asn)/Glu-tRNA(Gln) amidotransferase subunit GatA [Ectothiorhodospiraceae bacterium AqS1]MBF2759658.1 Asp-tRNA(Asn)/Glu-tRNA(Gln) amidotransferase subunit GatA [Ectothiorhodospiraceae bacterium AqS1]